MKAQPSDSAKSYTVGFGLIRGPYGFQCTGMSRHLGAKAVAASTAAFAAAERESRKRLDRLHGDEPDCRGR